MEYRKYLPLGLFLLFAGKLLIFNVNWESIGALVIVGLLSAYYEFKEQSKLIKELSLKINGFDRQIKEIEDLRTHVTGLRLGQQMRPTQSRLG